MEVIFKGDWFSSSPEVEKAQGTQRMSGKLYEASDTPQYVPDSYKGLLPATAEVVTEAVEVEEDAPPDDGDVGKVEVGKVEVEVAQAKETAAQKRASAQKRAAAIKAEAKAS